MTIWTAIEGSYDRLEKSKHTWTWIALYLTGYACYSHVRELNWDSYYYWLWSQHLSASYLDGPPLIAYLIKISTLFFGSTMFAINILPVITSALTVYIYYRTIRLTYNTKTARFSSLIFFLNPLFYMDILSELRYDNLLLLSTTLSLYFACSYTKQPSPKALYGLALSLGFAVLSKYQGIILLIGLLVASVGITDLRTRLYYNKHTYAACIIFFALISPILYWNFLHDWASFKFQLSGHTNSAGSFRNTIKNTTQYLITYGYIIPIAIIIHHSYKRKQSGSSFTSTQKLLIMVSITHIIFWLILGHHSSTLKCYHIPAWPALAFLLTDIIANPSSTTKKIIFFSLSLAAIASVISFSTSNFFNETSRFRRNWYDRTNLQDIKKLIPHGQQISLSGNYQTVSSAVFWLHKTHQISVLHPCLTSNRMRYLKLPGTTIQASDNNKKIYHISRQNDGTCIKNHLTGVTLIKSYPDRVSRSVLSSKKRTLPGLQVNLAEGIRT